MTNTDAAREWLTWLYGEQPDGLLWIGGHGDGFGGRTFTDIESAVTYAAYLDASERGGVYHRLATMRPIAEWASSKDEERKSRGRGAAADSAYLPAFAMDLDIRGPGHKSDRYPESESDLVQLLRKAGLPEPTTWVHSGGGLYPFWKLEHPVDLTLPGELQRAAKVSSDLHRLVIAWANEQGWKVDNTSDLARVYRLPGTMNRKGDTPVMAKVVFADVGIRFGMRELAGAVAIAPRPREVDPGPDAPRTPAAGAPLAGASQLFADAVVSDGPRVFTLAEAMTFVQPFLEALRTAQDGEINVRLNDAAKALSHFGEEFWSREAARGQLEAALASTEYDGATWDAEDTIASAYRSARDDWTAVLRQEPSAALAAASEAVEVDAVEALLAEMLTPEQIKQRPGKRYLIKTLLNLDSESWMIGAPGSRKSFVALDMAAHVAAGRDWQGFKVHQGNVVIIAAEGAGGIGKRIDAWEAEHGPMPQNVHILPRPVQTSNVGAWAVLVKACERLEPVFMIVDTQARVTAGLNENAPEDMSVYLVAITAMRTATGACVLSIHHTGRADRDARGHSSMDGAQDTELKVVALKEPLSGELRVEKQKDLPERDPLKLTFKLHEVGVDEDGDPVTSLALAAPSGWEAARSQVEEVEPWEAGHAAVITQIFKVLRDQGGEAGLTKSEARLAVLERFYGGEAKRLHKATWFTGWSRAQEKAASNGDRVMVNTRGERWAVDLMALENLVAE